MPPAAPLKNCTAWVFVGTLAAGLAPACGGRVSADGPDAMADAPGEPDLNDGLVAHYLWNGDAVDQTANHLDGRLEGASTFGPDMCGNPASAFVLDGTGAYANLGASVLLKPTDVVSVSMWIRATAFGTNNQNLISDHAPNETSVGSAYILRLASADLQFMVGGPYGLGESTYAQVDVSGHAAAWTHLVAVYDGADLVVYVDGVPGGTAPYAMPLTQNENPVLVGASGFGEYFAGSVDDTRIYHRALDARTVAALYALGACTGDHGD